MKNSIGIVIPAYNPNLKVLERYVKDLEGALHPDLIIVEIDEPDERELNQLEEMSVRIEISDTKRGKGAAITRGFDRLESDILVFVDADGSVPVKSVEKVCNSIGNSSIGLAVGSRRHPDSDVKSHQGNIRKLLGDGFSFISRILLEVKLYDYQCGAKAIERNVWKEVRDDIEREGFSWDIELISVVSAMGHKIEEIPIEWEDQPGSTVKIIPAIIELLNALVSVRRKVTNIKRRMK